MLLSFPLLILIFFSVHGNNPPLSVVRRFVHLLDIGDLDYTEEIGSFCHYPLEP